MSTWEQFEIDCTRFLMEQFCEYATFIHQGGSDSTVPDIKVTTKKNKQFYIEAKHSPAQCGQFVLLPNVETRKFEYSRLNSTEINEFSKVIINHMNNNFEEFKEAGTAGKNIEFDNCTFRKGPAESPRPLKSSNFRVAPSDSSPVFEKIKNLRLNNTSFIIE